MNTSADEQRGSRETDTEVAEGPPRSRSLRWSALAPANVSAIYLFAVIVAFFAWKVPDTFLAVTTVKTILGRDAVTALVALGLIVPLATGSFDLSVGSALGMGGVIAGWMQVKQGYPLWIAVLTAIGVGLLIGTVNALMVVRFRIDSFVATLGMSAVVSGLVLGLSNGQQITGLSAGFKRIAQRQLFGLSYSVYYVLVIAVVLWVILEHMPLGRYLYATGGGREAARLAGVQTDRYRFGALVTSSTIAALAGVIEASTISSASKDVGATFVLPAFAAAFFGATQLKGGRFNVWGTCIAVYSVATGVKGLELWTDKFWVKDVFYGVVLTVAVGIASVQRGSKADRGASRVRERLISRMRRPSPQRSR